MIGQDKILNQLKNALPDTTLLVGPSGCGKHLMVDELSKYYNLPLIDITENISDEYIAQMHLRALPTLYLIDLTKLSDKEQNIVLKCVEEPSETFKIILIATNRESVLNTVLNRSICYQFDEYSKDILRNFIPKGCEDNDLLLDIVKTPGQLKDLTNYKINDMIDVGNKIVSKINIANYPNALSISTKRINYKDEYDKFNLDVFLELLKVLFFNEYLETSKDINYKLYLITTETISKLRDSRLNKRFMFENYLTKIWMEARENVS